MPKQDEHISKPTEQPIKDFDAVAWVRARRDELHRKYADVPTREFVQRLSEEGKQTELWKRLMERHRRPSEAA